jgi:SPP1 gp7 family putative phage head morphogenesis protein
LSGFDNIIEKIAQDLHKGKIKPSDLNQELISGTYKELNEAAHKGYGKDWVKFPKDGKGNLPIELKKNLYAFSGAKTYAQLEELNRLLYDNEGKLRPFNEYKVLAKKLNRQYNENWLQAEWQTARTAAQMAQKWEKLQETKDLFPNLKYRTAGDDRVRPKHKALDGIIKPIDDPFWSKYYPPLDWRCRCDVVATAEDTTSHKEEDLPEPDFKGNVGKDKEIFTKKGTFFKLARTDENATRNLELSKLNAPYEVAFKGKTGKKVDVNIYAHDVDLEENIRVASIIVETFKVDVSIRPHINSRLVKGHKNPEYLIKNRIGERKAPTSKDYTKSLSKANKQGCEIVVIDLSKNNDTINNAKRMIEAILRPKNVHTNIKEVYIVSKDGKTVGHYKREKAD